MALLGYNKRLIWVIIPLVLWAFTGLLLAAGVGARDGVPAPLNLKLNLPEGGLWLHGQLLSITEDVGILTLRIAVRPGKLSQPDNPHTDLVIERVESTRPLKQRPNLAISGNDSIIFPNGRGAALTEKYLIRFGSGDVWIIPRPPEMDSARFHQMLRQHKRDRDKRYPPGDGLQRRRIDGERPGTHPERQPHPRGSSDRGR